MITTIKQFRENVFKPYNLALRQQELKDTFIKLISQETVKGDLKIDHLMLNLDPSLFKMSKIEGVLELQNKDLTKLPTWLRRIKYCRGLFLSRNKLKTLLPCPTEIDGHFSCTSNHLKNLLFGPTIVSGNYYCWNNYLTSLKGLPKYIGGDLWCYSNYNVFKINDIPSDTIIKGKIYFTEDKNEA